MDKIVDAIFIIDIIIMFRTKYRDTKRDIMVSDSKQIAINYIFGRFLIDLLASFPFDLMYNSSNQTGLETSHNGSSIFQLLKLIKVLRLSRLFSYMRFIASDLKFGMKIA